MRPDQSVRSIAAFLTLALTAFLLPSSDLAAQGGSLSWSETSTVEVPGPLGMILRAMPGALESRTRQQSIHVQGGTLVQGDAQHAVLMDADNRRVLSVDHEARTYTTITFDESAQMAGEMNAMMSEAVAGADEAMADVRAERDRSAAELRRAMEEARSQLSFLIDSESTGRTRTFGDAGTARQHIITAMIEGAEPPTGVEDAPSGSLVFVMEVWQSDDLPTADAFYEQWGQRLADDPQIRSMAADVAGTSESLTDVSATALAGWDPRISAGLTEVVGVVEELDGTTVHSVATIALVAADHDIEPQALLAWEPGSAGDQLREAAGGAVREAASSAVSNALGGLFGGGDKKEEEEAEVEPVRPLLKVTTTKEDIVYSESDDGAVATLRQQLEGYREITMAELMEDAGGR